MTNRVMRLVAVGCLAVSLAADERAQPPNVLPATAAATLVKSLDASRQHPRHLWRDTAPMTGDLVNAYIEIPRGERRKYEFDMRANARAIDRIIDQRIGGYPVNYGFVPQTVSYDGDPFDVLVLGPPLPGGRFVRGVIVGLMLMNDEKGLDSKVVLSLVGSNGRPTHQLTESDRTRLTAYFKAYKRLEPGKFSDVSGWGSSEDGRAFVTMTHAFFEQCRTTGDAPCTISGNRPALQSR